jgi:hypothetical protein
LVPIHLIQRGVEMPDTKKFSEFPWVNLLREKSALIILILIPTILSTRSDIGQSDNAFYTFLAIIGLGLVAIGLAMLGRNNKLPNLYQFLYILSSIVITILTIALAIFL